MSCSIANSMKGKKLAIIGASYLQLPLVRKAKEMGIETFCFAWADGAVCKEVADHFYPIDVKEKEQIYQICKEVGINGITTIAADLPVATINYVAARLGLVSNPLEYTDVTTNKYLMRQCFLTHNIPCPRFALVDESSLGPVAGFQYPLIVKPTDRSGSKGVKKVLNSTQLSSAVRRAQKESFEHKAIVEEFVTGREVSVEAISYGGKHYILQITDKVTTGEPFFVELEHHQPSSLPDEVKNAMKQIVLRALDALHIQFGASHSELMVDENGEITVIEIGARMGGDFIGSDLVCLSTGYDFLRGVIEVALGSFQEPVMKEHSYSGVYFLSEETSYLLPVIEHRADYPQIMDAGITHPTLRRIECSGDRSGFVLYKSNKKETFMKKVVVFGATGTVGAYACLHLSQCGYHVIAVGGRADDGGFFADYGMEYYSVDIQRASEFTKLPQDGVAAVVHLAGMLPARMHGYKPQRYIDVNMTGTLNILVYCAQAKVGKVIYSQSISDVSHLCGTPNPISADALTSFPLNNDHSVYAISKNAAVQLITHYAAKYGMKYYILRFPNIYLYHPNPYYYVDGEQRWQGYRLMIHKAIRGEPIEIWGNPKKVRDIVYVKDCCQIIERCLSTKGADCGMYNVGTGIGTTMEEQVRGIVDVFSPAHAKSPIFYNADKPDAVEYVFDMSKTEHNLGYHMEYGYRRYLADFKAEMRKQTFAKLWGLDMTGDIEIMNNNEY